MVILSQQPKLLASNPHRYNIGYMEMKDRIARRMAELKITQESLAEQTGLSQTAIHKILKGGGTRKVVEIARALNCTPEYLQLGGVPEPSNISPAEVKGWIPLISYIQAGQWSEAVDLYEPGFAEQARPTTVCHSANTFALRVEGDSMTLPEGVRGKSFPHGMIIYVDPNRAAATGDFVVAKECDTGHVTFKQLATEEGRPVLMPLNPDRKQYPVIRNEFHIIGRVIDASWGGL